MSNHRSMIAALTLTLLSTVSPVAQHIVGGAAFAIQPRTTESNRARRAWARQRAIKSPLQRFEQRVKSITTNHR